MLNIQKWTDLMIQSLFNRKGQTIVNPISCSKELYIDVNTLLMIQRIVE